MNNIQDAIIANENAIIANSNSHLVITTTLPASSTWSTSADTGISSTVLAVSGILATDYPHITPYMTSGMTQAAFITVLEEWNKIKWAFATDGKITFYT